MKTRVIVAAPQSESKNSDMALFLFVVILLAIVGLLFFYGLPFIQNIGKTQINIPDHVNVNVQNQSK